MGIELRWKKKPRWLAENMITFTGYDSEGRSVHAGAAMPRVTPENGIQNGRARLVAIGVEKGTHG